MKENIGYVAIEFDEASKQKVANWASHIGRSDLVTATIDGKIKGGDVTDELHLTIFYGLDENALDQN